MKQQAQKKSFKKNPNKPDFKTKQRNSVKFQKEARKMKNNGKKVTDDEDDEDLEGIDDFNNADEDKFETGNSMDDYKQVSEAAEESEVEENMVDMVASDDDSEIYDPALFKSQQKLLQNHPPLLIILDLASLETVKTRKGDFQLLNCDDHISLIRKYHKDPSEYRPDIIHQELMTVLDSPLNKAGKIKVIVHTEKNVLFEVSNKTRIPRTFKRFSGLMVQLLHRLKIRSADGRDMLLKVIKNPISRYIPAGAKCIGKTFMWDFGLCFFFVQTGFSDQGKYQTPMQFAKSIPALKDESKFTPLVLVFGAQATKGIKKEDHPYVRNFILYLPSLFILFFLVGRNGINIESWIKWCSSH
jgi:rRNA small subunit pseudouridine methyltransferase Nep1